MIMKNIFDIKFRRKYIYSQILLLILLGLCSCNEDFFERVSTPTLKYKSLNEAEMGIFAPYQKFVQGSDRSPYWMIGFMHFGMSDIVREIGQNGYNDVYSRSTSNQSSAVYNLFSPSFQIISGCNYMIEFLESNPFGDISESDKINNQNRLIGEAYFMRAHSYLQLVSIFCPAYDPNGSNDSKLLPLRTKFASSMEIALDVEPVETGEIYNQIVSDLIKAEELLPKKYIAGMDESYQYGRATKHAAMSVLAKVYMLMGKYDEALVKLNGVLNDTEVPRTLLSEPVNCFLNNSTTPWSDSEIIWYGNFADPDLSVSTSYRHPNDFMWFVNYNFPLVNTYQEWWIWALNQETLKRVGIINPDNSETDAWKADKRRTLYKRFEGFLYNPILEKGRTTLSSNSYTGYVGANDPVYIANKYFLVPGEANYTDPFQNIPLIRSSELYLMRAGIKALNGSGGQAADLNIVRSRSWDASIGGAYVPLTDAQVTWDVVDNEWIKEMAFESDRVLWLQSFKKPIGPGNRNTETLNAPYANFYWPVLQGELDFRN